jgi:MFS family permease
MSAWFSRVFGRKNYYLRCVALFTLTSLLCGLAPTLGIMLSSRVLQGIAGGGLAPVAQAVLVDTFPVVKRASTFALYTIVIVTAPAIGPVLGGWITDNYSWRRIFFINPVGIMALLLTSRFVQDPPAFEAERATVRRGGKLSVDRIGIGLIALASGTLEVALDRGQIEDWLGSSFILLDAGAGNIRLYGDLGNANGRTCHRFSDARQSELWHSECLVLCFWPRVVLAHHVDSANSPRCMAIAQLIKGWCWVPVRWSSQR